MQRSYIDQTDSVTNDLWREYLSLSKDYNISQIESNGDKNFMPLHTALYQIKSWIRTTYSW